jgi:predicted ATPase
LEIERVYAQAWQLCQQVGDTPQRSPALFGLWVFYLVRADYEMAHKLGEQLLEVAQHTQNPAYLMEAHQVQGINAFYLGRLGVAQEHLGTAMELYEPQQQGFQTSYTGANAGVACLSHAALVWWLRGYPDQGEQCIQEALSLAERLNHPYSQVFALSFAAWFYQYCGESALAIQYAETALAASTEQAFELLLPFSLIFKGWGLVKQGQAQRGVAEIRQGLDAFLATGAELGHLYFLALLAEAYASINQVEAGLHLLTEAIITAEEKGERFYEAELHRLKGELLRKQGSAGAENEAEHCFRRAMSIAEHQQAKSLQLRAALSLARTLITQKNSDEAKKHLATIYQAFSEGFDTADLKEAKTLLEQLS